MIDWTRVSDLREEIGAEDFAEVVEIFLEEVEAAMENLGDDHAGLEAKLHFLKGSALNLGFADFSDLCGAGENRAADGATDIDLKEITGCYAASREAFLEGLATRYAA